MDHNEDIDKEIRISLSIFLDIVVQGGNEVMRSLSLISLWHIHLENSVLSSFQTERNAIKSKIYFQLWTKWNSIWFIITRKLKAPSYSYQFEGKQRFSSSSVASIFGNWKWSIYYSNWRVTSLRASGKGDADPTSHLSI